MLSLLTKSTTSQYGRGDEANPYWISFSDIMAGLLVIFILAALLLILQLTQQREKIDKAILEIEKANHVRSELLAEIKEALEQDGIKVEISENDSVLRIPSKTLNFASDRAHIPDDRIDVVEKIGIQLINGINRSNRRSWIDTIFVEGHTDRLPSKYKEVGNWLLSTDRAISVWRFWGQNESTKQLHEIKNFSGEHMFSVSGYAETRRVEEEDVTDELREANRRIDLRFTMKQPRVCEYQEVRGIDLCN